MAGAAQEGPAPLILSLHFGLSTRCGSYSLVTFCLWSALLVACCCPAGPSTVTRQALGQSSLGRAPGPWLVRWNQPLLEQ